MPGFFLVGQAEAGPFCKPQGAALQVVSPLCLVPSPLLPNLKVAPRWHATRRMAGAWRTGPPNCAVSPSNPRSKQPLGPFPTCLPNTALLRGSPRKSVHLPSVILPADAPFTTRHPGAGGCPAHGPRPTTLGHSPFPSGSGVWAWTLRPPGHPPTGQLPSVTPICPPPASVG